MSCKVVVKSMVVSSDHAESVIDNNDSVVVVSAARVVVGVIAFGGMLKNLNSYEIGTGNFCSAVYVHTLVASSRSGPLPCGGVYVPFGHSFLCLKMSASRQCLIGE